MCVDCVLALLRIAQADPGRWTPPEVVLPHLCIVYLGGIVDTIRISITFHKIFIICMVLGHWGNVMGGPSSRRVRDAAPLPYTTLRRRSCGGKEHTQWWPPSHMSRDGVEAPPDTPLSTQNPLISSGLPSIPTVALSSCAIIISYRWRGG
jgi:hypothetical protein